MMYVSVCTIELVTVFSYCKSCIPLVELSKKNDMQIQGSNC